MSFGGLRACPKGETREVSSRRAKRQRYLLRRACRTEVWRRDQSRCRHCHRAVMEPREARSPAEIGHVHEWPMRSSGVNDGDDPRRAFLLCEACHLRGCHGWPRLEPAYESEAEGAYGEITWSWATDKGAGARE